MPDMRHFTRTEPERRLHRFYVVDVVPDLFGRTCVWLEWGRSGQPGTLRRQVYADPHDADTAAARVIRRRIQRGYFETLSEARNRTKADFRYQNSAAPFHTA